MLNLTDHTWYRFMAWMALGFVVYFAYSRSHSRLGRQPQEPPRTAAPT